MLKQSKTLFFHILGVLAFSTLIFIFLLGIFYLKGKQPDLVALYFICVLTTSVLLGYAYYMDYMNKKIETAINENDHETACYLLYKLAKRGHQESQFRLSLAYRDGLGVEQDDELFLYWLKKSAKNNNYAQYVYALTYMQKNLPTLETLKIAKKILKKVHQTQTPQARTSIRAVKYSGAFNPKIKIIN